MANDVGGKKSPHWFQPIKNRGLFAKIGKIQRMSSFGSIISLLKYVISVLFLINIIFSIHCK